MRRAEWQTVLTNVARLAEHGGGGLSTLAMLSHCFSPTHSLSLSLCLSSAARSPPFDYCGGGGRPLQCRAIWSIWYHCAVVRHDLVIMRGSTMDELLRAKDDFPPIRVCDVVGGCSAISPFSHSLFLRGTVAERWPLTCELSLSCARPAADGYPLLWVNRPLQVSRRGQLSLSSFWGR